MCFTSALEVFALATPASELLVSVGLLFVRSFLNFLFGQCRASTCHRSNSRLVSVMSIQQPDVGQGPAESQTKQQ